MNRAVPRLVLASASPRRAAILERLGIDYVVDPASVDEREHPGEGAAEHAARLAAAKAAEVATRHPGALVLAGDTVVTLEGRILGKPASEDEATRTLMELSGRRHRVVGALALATPPKARLHLRVDSTVVHFRPFPRSTAEAYVTTGEPMDKAGAYGIQGLGAALVREIEGDYYTVVGLSVTGLLSLLEEAGFAYRFHGLEHRRG